MVGIPCPIKLLTGLSCPGCGLTRAWLCALQGDLAGALAYHPLFWVVAPVAIVMVLCCTNRLDASDRHVKAFVIVCIAALLAVWAIRLASPADASLLFSPAPIAEADIVSFEPGQALPVRAALFLLGLLGVL